MAKQLDSRRYKTGRRPFIRIDTCTVTKKKCGKKYAVVINGVNLRPSVSPPIITVGMQRLSELNFSLDGRTISGVVLKQPKSNICELDYGFARAQCEFK